MKHLIGYHNDADGWASAALICATLHEVHGAPLESIHLYPLQHGTYNARLVGNFMTDIDTAIRTSNKDLSIWLLDYHTTALAKQLVEAGNAGVDIVIIEHHIDAEFGNVLADAKWANSTNVRLHIAISACMLTYLFLLDRGRSSFRTSKLVEAINDRDTGNYEPGGDVDAVTSALYVAYDGFPITNRDPARLVALGHHLMDDRNYDLHLNAGRLLVKDRMHRIDRAVSQRSDLRIMSASGSYLVPAAFVTPDMSTPVGMRLAKHAHGVVPGATLTVNRDCIVIGFRSVDGCETTALQLAELFANGGGHKHAAGASIEFSTLSYEKRDGRSRYTIRL